MSLQQDASRRATKRHQPPYTKVRNKREDKWARTPPSHFAVYTVVCVAILVMQSDLSSLPVATKVPSGEIAHPNTCKHNQHQTSSTSKAKKTYVTRVRLNRRLLDQLMRHCVHHSFLFHFLQQQLMPTQHGRHSLVRFERTADSC